MIELKVIRNYAYFKCLDFFSGTIRTFKANAYKTLSVRRPKKA